MTHLIALILLLTSPIWASIGFVLLVFWCLVCNLPKVYRAIHEFVVEIKEKLL